jgi:hypothetical protein
VTPCLRRSQRPWLALPSLLCASAIAGCAASSVPDPRSAVRAYSDAAARGDAAALYALLTANSRASLDLDEVKAIVASERSELAEQAKDLERGEVRVEASARLKFADGEEASLDFRDGRYGVTSAGALPGGGRSPRETLEQLRRVLARRSYDGLMRVLSTATRSSIEGDVRDLVQGLSDPDALLVRVTGDEARVPVPGGHTVILKREAGVWRVQNFD